VFLRIKGYVRNGCQFKGLMTIANTVYRLRLLEFDSSKYDYGLLIVE